MDGRISRRDFVRSGTAALAGFPLAMQDPPKRKYRACVIGHTGRGNYGHGLDRAFQNIPNITVVAVADPVETGRLAAARRIGVQNAYADWREMLKKEKPDLVSIGPRWIDQRLEMVTGVAEAGAHIYMEKPVAGSLEEADKLVAAADKKKIKIAVALQALPAPRIHHLRSLIQDGLIGDLLEIRTRGKEDRRSGGEDLAVLGTHCMYLMRFFAGDAEWCSSRVTVGNRDVKREDRKAASEPLGPVAGDTIHAAYAFAKGVQGHFASQKNPQRKGGKYQLTLYGTKGLAHFKISSDPQITFLADPAWFPGKPGVEWKPVPGAPSNDDPTGLKGAAASNKRIVEDLLRAIEKDVEPGAGIREGRAALEMILAVYASHLKAARAKLPLKEREHPLGSL